jgi:hypothetical protein
MIKIIFLPFLLLTTLIACKKNTENEISKIKVKYEFIEFHKDFFSANETELIELKYLYPYLFPTNISNKEWLNKINDSDDKTLFKITDSIYPKLNKIKNETYKLYQHITYYKPSFSAPKTFTLINGLNYENSILYADSLVFISLDLYLGANSEVYHSFPKYISANFEEENIAVDLAMEIIQHEFPLTRDRSFLGSMIYFGKQLYLAKLLLPHIKESTLLGIPEKKIQWSITNESQIWKYFISNELLFSTDKTLNKRFIDLAPFSKFYMDSDKESPGSIGTYIGLQIIRSYMENNIVPIDQMLITDADILFKKSRYKPSK